MNPPSVYPTPNEFLPKPVTSKPVQTKPVATREDVSLWPSQEEPKPKTKKQAKGKGKGMALIRIPPRTGIPIIKDMYFNDYMYVIVVRGGECKHSVSAEKPPTPAKATNNFALIWR